MSRITPKTQTLIAIDSDSLLHDSYLLVAELRQGGSVQGSTNLAELCTKQIETVRDRLKSAGYSQRNIDYISHAQCALLDEAILTCAKDETHADWAGEPLQAKFFSRHQAGESLYEDMREVLREPAPDLSVLTVFQRVLMLGFQGCYADANNPERMQLLAALNALVEPLKPSQTLPTKRNVGSGLHLRAWPQSLMGHVFAFCVLLAGVWWGLDYLLSDLIASLPSGQA
ncbi:type VI secretion system protein TssL, short form [Pseudomonas caspiana]|uniref:Type IV secretion protein DotU n=1 Tax=Pseudomonas caspiana TaxID=1451454 RepID=A0A1Y3NUF5_9PSED|nr:type VI secretion system protein TssL, short form [Pseudomonas caspiana]OUM71248.1 type IV secretion protein DotU [Pseudomonas caspiana]